MPGYLDLGTRMVILTLAAMSLDLLVGYCGLVTLGHAAFFGAGAYAAGIFALRVWADPVVGLLAGGAAAALLGLLSGAVLLRSRRLTLIMLSLATVLIVQEVANKMNWLTGGADGLQGIVMAPVLGQFAFDLSGRVSYAYAAIVLALGFLVFRSVVDSMFGKSLVGIRENEARMRALGTPVDARLRTAFVMSAALAGVAGALQAQVSEFVSLNAVERRVFRRDPDHVDPRRRRTPVRRLSRRAALRLHAGLPGAGGSDELVSLDRPVAPGDRVPGAGRTRRVDRRVDATPAGEAIVTSSVGPSPSTVGGRRASMALEVDVV